MSYLSYDFDELEIELLRVLKEICKRQPTIGLTDLLKKTNSKKINKDNILKILYWLKNKGFVDLKEKRKESFFINYKDKILPEEQLFNLLKEKKELELKKVSEEIKSFNIALGELKKEGVAEIKEGKIGLIKEEFESNVKKIEEKIKKNQELTKEEINYLKKRGLLGKKEVVDYIVEVKEKVKEIDLDKIKIKINKLTKEDIKTGRWKEIGIKKYSVTDPLPKIWGGRKHPLTIFLDKIKEIWISMGFKEKKYEIVVPALLNFDALMVPHDHLAREMQDTFYLEETKDLNEFKEVFEKVKEIHKRFYGYFDDNESKKLLLRTQDTVVSAYFLSQVMKEKEKLPAKIFSIGKVFRNETVDKTHLAEFFQSEGLVIGKNLTFEDLIGFIKEFFNKLGFKKIKFKIAYFPFTEPSLEVFVYHEGLKKFIELGGAGIFRKEINEIFGISKEYNMLAWGLGIERIAMLYYGLNDIRDLLSNKINIEFLRSYKIK